MVMRIRPVLAAIALAVVTASVSVGCAADPGARPAGSARETTTGAQQFVEGTGSTTRIPEGERKTAPELAGDDLQGRSVKLSDYRGKVVVVNIWASWCGPCQAEAKGLQQVYQETAAQGVQFLGINSGDLEIDNAREFERSYKITYPSLSDPDARLVLKFPKGTLNPQDIPTTLILDRKGRIAVRALHALGKEELHSAVRWVLDQNT